MEMREFIEKMLREELMSRVNDWRDNIVNNGNFLSTLISEDDKTGEKLFLVVGFEMRNKNSGEFMYYFMLHDKNGLELSDPITTKSEARNYLPTELQKQFKILPIVFELSRRLLTNFKPKIVTRRTVERLEGDSMVRYTNIFKKFGYEVTDQERVSSGYTLWTLNLKDDIKESTNIKSFKTLNEVRDLILRRK